MTEPSKKLYWVEFEFMNPEVLVLDDTEDLHQQVADYVTTVVNDESLEDIAENGPMFTTSEIKALYPLTVADPSGHEYQITLEPVPAKRESDQ